MLKTTLKIAALSVASLTFLSACGASDTLNNRANGDATEPYYNGYSLSVNSGKTNSGKTNSGEANVRNAINGSVNYGGVNVNNPLPVINSTVASNRYTGQYSNGGTFIKVPNLSTSELATNYNDDSHTITYAETQDTFAMSENSDGNLVMTVNGTDYIFTPEGNIPLTEYDLTPNPEPTRYTWKAVNAGHFYTAFSFNLPDIRDVLRGTNPDVQGTYVVYSTLDNGLFERYSIDVDLDYTDGFATVGIQTLPEVVASQTATAYYSGIATLELPVAQVEGIFDRGGVGRIDRNLELIMAVDFTGNTVKGLMTYSSSFIDENLDSNNHSIITLNSAPIVGNGFAGTFSMNDNFRNRYGIVDNPTGSYAGNFFGPNADDLAGVMQYKGTTAQGTEVGVGGFRADKEVGYGIESVSRLLENAIYDGNVLAPDDTVDLSAEEASRVNGQALAQ